MPPQRPTDQRRKSAGSTNGKGSRRATAKEALRQGEERYRALFKNMPVPLHAVDEDARLVEVNDAWLKLLGYSRDEVIGRPLTAIYTPESADRFHQHGWADLLARGEVHNVERHLRCKSGATITVLLSGSIERDSTGRFLRGYGVLIDITTRRKLERERERYFDMVQDFLTVTGFDGTIHDVNTAAAAAIGMSREQVLATSLYQFLHPQDRPVVDSAVEQFVAGASTVDVEVRYRYRDGSWHWSAWKSTAIAEDRLIFSVGRDTHEQRQAEEMLRRSERLEAIGQLTGGIAHDFNNLLTVVIGNLDRIVSSGRADERTRQLAEVALEGAERGARLTEHLLAFARRQRLEPQVLRLDELLPRMEPLYRRAVGEAVELRFTLAPGLWPCRADPGRLETAVLNLILNARDATPEGGRVTVGAANVSVAPREVARLAPGDYLVISVRDTGSGMPPEILERAFEPFFSTKAAGKGAGLGLSMVYGFAEQSGGTARIESCPGAGTTVYLYLPRAKEEPAGEAIEPSAAAMDTRPPVTILVVEDEPSVRRITADILKELGHRVLIAGNGPEALATLQQEPAVDLLITDMVMPGGMSGITLASVARQSRPQLRVLLVTGYGFGANGDRIAADGFDVLRKPYRPAQLSAKVQEVIGRPARR
jgi:PAS domain S-box-containing protein